MTVNVFNLVNGSYKSKHDQAKARFTEKLTHHTSEHNE